LGEEPGWRGFALPRLEARTHPIAAALSGSAATVDLPAIAIPELLGPLTLENFATFTLTGTAATFLYVWVYNHSRGSILTSIVLHAASNAASSLLTNLFADNNVPLDALPIPYRWLNVIAFGAAALILIAATRGRLGYHEDSGQAAAPTPQPAAQALACHCPLAFGRRGKDDVAHRRRLARWTKRHGP
jgi:membrane protease YdiL (CAAX protease family)